MTDPELKAMEVLLKELKPLDQEAIARILSWAANRHGMELSAALPAIKPRKPSRQPRKPAKQTSWSMTEELLRSA